MVLVWSHCWHTSACAAIPCHTMLYMLYIVVPCFFPFSPASPQCRNPSLGNSAPFLLLAGPVDVGIAWTPATLGDKLMTRNMLKRSEKDDPTNRIRNETWVPKVGKSSDSKRDARGNMERNQWGRAWGAEWFGARKLEWVGRQNYCEWVKVQNELCQTLKIAVSCSLSQANSIFARLSSGSVSAKASFGRLSHSDGIYAVRFLL